MLAVFVRMSNLGTKAQQCWFLPELLALVQFQREQLLARANALYSPTRSSQPIYKLIDGDVGFEFLRSIGFLAGFLVLATHSPQNQVFLPDQLFELLQGLAGVFGFWQPKNSLQDSLLLSAWTSKFSGWYPERPMSVLQPPVDGRSVV